MDNRLITELEDGKISIKLTDRVLERRLKSITKKVCKKLDISDAEVSICVTISISNRGEHDNIKIQSGQNK